MTLTNQTVDHFRAGPGLFGVALLRAMEGDSCARKRSWAFAPPHVIVPASSQGCVNCHFQHTPGSSTIGRGARMPKRASAASIAIRRTRKMPTPSSTRARRSPRSSRRAIARAAIPRNTTSSSTAIMPRRATSWPRSTIAWPRRSKARACRSIPIRRRRAWTSTWSTAWPAPIPAADNATAARSRSRRPTAARSRSTT